MMDGNASSTHCTLNHGGATEGTIKYKLTNLSTLSSDGTLSPPIRLQGAQCKILARKVTKNDKTTLSLALHVEADDPNWIGIIQGRSKIIPHRPDVPPRYAELDTYCTRKKNQRGIENVPMQDLQDPARGYLAPDGGLQLEVDIAIQPHGTGFCQIVTQSSRRPAVDRGSDLPCSSQTPSPAKKQKTGSPDGERSDPSLTSDEVSNPADIIGGLRVKNQALQGQVAASKEDCTKKDAQLKTAELENERLKKQVADALKKQQEEQKVVEMVKRMADEMGKRIKTLEADLLTERNNGRAQNSENRISEPEKIDGAVSKAGSNAGSPTLTTANGESLPPAQNLRRTPMSAPNVRGARGGGALGRGR